MLKKAIILFFIIKIASYAVGGLAVVYSIKKPCPSIGNVYVDKNQASDPSQISKILMEKNLEQFKSKSICFKGWIRNYKIDSVVLNENGFTAEITYSVRPFTFFQRKHWMTGDGSLDKWGWIKNKQTQLTVSEKDNKYTMSAK